jgi:hypothetical protein
MSRTTRVLAGILTMLAGVADAQTPPVNFCMDCIQKQTQHTNPIWFESDGFCCNWPCEGFTGYEMKQQDRGAGCLVTEVNNELVRGDFCDSNDTDLGCPEPPPPSNGGGGGWAEVINPGSPIILDLGDDTYRLTSVADGVRFDLRNNGQACQVAWTRLGVENAFLALDRNGNGRIENGAELFGNFTPLRSGQLAGHGFEALREMDGNGDGILNATDGAWSALLLWVDRNHDGVSTPGELQPISSSAVTELELDPRVVGRKDQWGNQFRYMAHFRFRHASAEARRTYYDVFFRMGE